MFELGSISNSISGLYFRLNISDFSIAIFLVLLRLSRCVGNIFVTITCCGIIIEVNFPIS